MTRTHVYLTGQTFGRLTVLRRVENNGNNGKIRDSKSRAARYLCICSCESKTETVVVGYALKNGNTKSCGCLRRESATWSAPMRARTKRTGLALTDEALRSLYEDQQLSTPAIATQLSVSPKTVIAWLRSAGVGMRSLSTAVKIAHAKR